MGKEKILYTIIAVLSIVLLLMILKNMGNYTEEALANYEEETVAFKSLETPVEVLLLKKQTLTQTISCNGIVKAQKQTDINAKVSGIVKELYYKDGDFVQKDAPILKIDDESYMLDYLKAKDQVQKTLAEYGIMILGEDQTGVGIGNRDSLVQSIEIRSEALLDQDAFDLLEGKYRKEMLASKAGLTSARLDLQKAEINLRNTEIKAPFDGYIAELELCLDGNAKAGEKLMKIVALDRLYIEVGVLETEIPFIHKGALAKVEIPAFPGQSFKGTVSSISPILDPESGTCRTLIKVDNPKRLIKPGMYANVTIETQSFVDKLLISRDALLVRDERLVTFVYENGLAKWHYVQTGLENDDFLEIVEGLSEGDSLITSGHFNLAHDAKVVIVQKD